MRVLQLTAGTGNFYCGNCDRDVALTRALRRLGHDAFIVPLYLPIMSEHADVTAENPIFLGGMNVYLQHKSRLFRKTPRWFDALLDSPGLLRKLVAHSHMTRASDLGSLTVSMLRGGGDDLRKELDRLLNWLDKRERPDIVNLANLLLAGLADPIRNRLGAPVVCMLNGEDAFLDSLAQPYRTQAWERAGELARQLDGLIGVSRYYADTMASRLALEPGRIDVIHNGIELEGYECAPPQPSQPVRPVLGYLARMEEAKGLTTLVEAFIELKRRGTIPNLEMHIGGSMTPGDVKYVTRLKGRLREAGVAEDVCWMPNLTHEQKLRFFSGLTVFSVPATYGEAFGLYILEAFAAGVPVVQPRHGAFPELIERTGGGLLCDPDDPIALADALEKLLRDSEQAKRLGERGRRAVVEYFNMDRMAREIEVMFGRVIDESRGRRNDAERE